MSGRVHRRRRKAMRRARQRVTTADVSSQTIEPVIQLDDGTLVKLSDCDRPSDPHPLRWPGVRKAWHDYTYDLLPTGAVIADALQLVDEDLRTPMINVYDTTISQQRLIPAFHAGRSQQVK